MTRENAKDYLPLVQALAEGKLERKHPTLGWIKCDYLFSEDRDPTEFRVRQEPRRWWIVEQNPGCPGLAYPAGSGMVAGGTPIIEVIEVIK